MKTYTLDELMDLYEPWHKNEHKEWTVPCDAFCGVPYFLAFLRCREEENNVPSENAEKTEKEIS